MRPPLPLGRRGIRGRRASLGFIIVGGGGGVVCITAGRQRWDVV